MSIHTNKLTANCLQASKYEPRTIVDLLRHKAREEAGKQCYTFLPDEGRPAIDVTYGELDRRARAVGAWLQASDATDQRVLLLFPSGIEYIVAFFGCLYARSVAVPAYPPRANRQPGRIQAIGDD